MPVTSDFAELAAKARKSRLAGATRGYGVRKQPVDRASKPYRDGFEAGANGRERRNPYDGPSFKVCWQLWDAGFREGLAQRRARSGEDPE